MLTLMSRQIIFKEHLKSWTNLSPCWTDVEVYFRMLQHTVTSLLSVVTGAIVHTSDYNQP